MRVLKSFKSLDDFVKTMFYNTPTKRNHMESNLDSYSRPFNGKAYSNYSSMKCSQQVFFYGAFSVCWNSASQPPNPVKSFTKTTSNFVIISLSARGYFLPPTLVPVQVAFSSPLLRNTHYKFNNV